MKKERWVKEEKCWLDNPDIHQCCCVCRFHLADHYHCSVDMELRNRLAKHYGKDECICGIQKGWICAGFAFEGRVYSNWPEHGIGCELFEERKAPKKDKLAAHDLHTNMEQKKGENNG